MASGADVLPGDVVVHYRAAARPSGFDGPGCAGVLCPEDVCSPTSTLTDEPALEHLLVGYPAELAVTLRDLGHVVVGNPGAANPLHVIGQPTTAKEHILGRPADVVVLDGVRPHAAIAADGLALLSWPHRTPEPGVLDCDRSTVQPHHAPHVLLPVREQVAAVHNHIIGLVARAGHGVGFVVDVVPDP